MALNEPAERPVVFDCQGNELIGITTLPDSTPPNPIGVLIVVGGPQYRVGSHRQFTLLCRYLAEQGIASFRFDYHGLGDSAGPPALGVDGIENDVRASIDVFTQAVPTLTGVVLWGLCGAASASALYAPSDFRVKGLVMLNPWVRTEEGLAKARLRHYYLGRLGDAQFWSRIMRGDVDIGSAVRAFGANVAKATGWRGGRRAVTTGGGSGGLDLQTRGPESLPERMLACLLHRRLPTLIVLSGSTDLTANEFRQVAGSSEAWRRWMKSPAVECHEIEGSNHTFARADWRDRVAELTARWVRAR